MLAPNQLIRVKITRRNYEHYHGLGYDVQCKDIIMVPPEHLTVGSHDQVLVICDICGKPMEREFKTYITHRKYGIDTCAKCKTEKNKITNTEKYGCENPMQSDEIQKRARATMLDKYGVESPAKLEKIREKMRLTTLRKYGVEYAAQSDVVKEQMKSTCLDKYGVTHFSHTQQYKEKMAATCQEKYGADTPFQSSEILQKARQTFLEKYGVENPIQIPEVREKVQQTLMKNGTCKTSKQQIQLHEMIKKKYPDALLNYPFSTCSLDIFIEIKGVKIDCEYDCWYWHQDQQRDMRRDKFLQSEGFKTLRIKSGKLLPTEQELFDAIDYLVNTEHHFKEIILSDWKEKEEEECQKQ